MSVEAPAAVVAKYFGLRYTMEIVALWVLGGIVSLIVLAILGILGYIFVEKVVDWNRDRKKIKQWNENNVWRD